MGAVRGTGARGDRRARGGSLWPAVCGSVLGLMAAMCVASPSLAQLPGPVAGVTAGATETCAVGSDTHTYCWGLNNHGQLGDGTTTNRSSAVAVKEPAGVTLTNVSAGFNYTCAVGSDTRVYCWGDNFFGELGDGTNTSRSSPVPVAAAGGVILTQVSAGGGHTCAVGSDTKVYCWGNNSVGQLGDGTTTNQSSPVPVAAPAGVTLTHVSAGGVHTCAIGSDTKVHCWGGNSLGQVGDGTTTDRSGPVPVAAPAGVTLTQLSAGSGHTCAIGSDTKVYCWGGNNDGRLGDGTTTNRSSPVPVVAPAGVSLTQVSAGGNQTCALGSDARAYCWGLNNGGQLGDGTTTRRSTPTAVAAPAGVTLTQVSAGFEHTCAVGSDKHAYCWGFNNAGQLGDGTTTNRSSPVGVLMLPQPPSGVSLVAGDRQVTASWQPPADLGSGTLVGYTATASPGGATCTTAGATTCTITGLTDGTPYTVTVVVTTTVGASSPSTPAGPVTPVTRAASPGPVPVVATSPSPASLATTGTPTAATALTGLTLLGTGTALTAAARYRRRRRTR